MTLARRLGIQQFVAILFICITMHVAQAVDFNWVPVITPPDPTEHYSGNWTSLGHWNGGAGFPNGPTNNANVVHSNVGPFTVTLDADIHIGNLNWNSPDATLDATSRVLRVDGAADLLSGTMNLIHGQLLDSGAGH